MRCFAAIAVLAILLNSSSPARSAGIEAEQVRRAIENGVRFLKGQQQNRGNWQPHSGAYDTTGLVALSLVNSGVDPKDESLQRAVTYLGQQEFVDTYSVALQIMALSAIEPEKNLVKIMQSAKWLQDRQTRPGGSWGYKSDRTTANNSTAQFALLGLWEAERALQRYGVKSPIEQETWRSALTHWESSQIADGSWGYTAYDEDGRGSMTCAGIASVLICRERLNQGGPEIHGEEVLCCGAGPQEGDHVDRALAWLARHFSVTHNPGQPVFSIYYLYALERVGRLTAQRLIGNHDWYREGVEVLLKGQDTINGTFRGKSFGEGEPIIATSLALLFLAKGRRPVVMSKLKYGPPGNNDWDFRTAGVPNLVRYTEVQWKRDLTWQVMQTKNATAEDYLHSPVLFLSASEPLEFTDEGIGGARITALREYLDRGGFLFIEAVCDKTDGVHQSVKELVDRLFPEPEFQLQPLERDHEIWRYEKQVGPEYAGHLWGVSVGCRTSLAYCDTDLSCLWELYGAGGVRELPASVNSHVESALALGVNVLAYATGRDLRYRYENFDLDQPRRPVAAQDRYKLIIPKLRHDGGWNAAPAALVSLQRMMASELGLLVPTDQRELDISSDSLRDFHLLFMHGRNGFSFNEEERAALRTYIENGGMIFADAVCASEAFGKSFRKEMAAIFGNNKLERIPPEDKMFTPAYDGFDLQQVNRRQPGSGGEGPVTTDVRKVPPFLEGVKIKDRWAVIFSKYDLSCALESHEAAQCEGYTRADAARIAINVVLYSLHE